MKIENKYIDTSKIRINNKAIHTLFGIPMRNLQMWNIKPKDNWRKKLLDELKQISLIVDASLQNLQDIFNKKEMKIIILSFENLDFTADFLTKKDFLYKQFSNSFFYNNKVASIIPKNNINIIKETISSKLLLLDPFSKYILAKIVFGFWNEKSKEEKINIDEYLQSLEFFS